MSLHRSGGSGRCKWADRLGTQDHRETARPIPSGQRSVKSRPHHSASYMPTWNRLSYRSFAFPPQKSRKETKRGRGRRQDTTAQSEQGGPRPQGGARRMNRGPPPDRRTPTEQPHTGPSTQQRTLEAGTGSRGMRSYDQGEVRTGGETDAPGARTVQAAILTGGVAPTWCSPSDPSSQLGMWWERRTERD